MSLFVIFQEPFYRAIVASRVVRPLRLPDSSETKIIGYADDSNIFIVDNNSLIEIFELILKFERATGFKLNRDKTKIFGVGKWANKQQWSIDWLKVEMDSFHTLGIVHSNTYEVGLNLNWNLIINKMKQHVNMLLSRSINQRPGKRSVFKIAAVLL